MKAEGGSPNLINGVSLQDPDVRLPSQLSESVNQFPTVTNGLIPRNPSILLNRYNTTFNPLTRSHIIDRDENERYVVHVSPDGVLVHELGGFVRSVTTPDGIGYLSGVTDRDDYELMTVADHTYVLNKTKVVTNTSAMTDPLPAEALVHIVSGEYNSDYIIKIDGVQVAMFKVPGGPFDDNAFSQGAEFLSRPREIAYILTYGSPTRLDLAPGCVWPTNFGSTSVNNLTTQLPTGFTFTVLDNVIHIAKTTPGNFTIEVTAGGNQNAIRAHKGMVVDFSELPRRAPNGYRIKVAGSKDTEFDDYWVKFDQQANDGQGRWVETVAPSTHTTLDPATMPHLLVRNGDGTFTFKRATWTPRQVGDTTSNPWPSFWGQKLNGLAFAKNRLGLLAGETPVFSQVGEFYNFFVKSVLTKLDTDPIDTSISYEDVATVHHAVALSGQLILFTSSVPFRMAGGDVFSQRTVSYVPTLSNKSSPKVRPVASGNRLFFVNDTESGCFVHEFLNIQDETIQEAPCINEHALGYVPTGVTRMVAHENLKLLVLHSPADPTTLYVYKWLWIGQEKAQSAWQKWTFAFPIREFKFVDDKLIIVSEADSAWEYLSVPCHEEWKDQDGVTVLLDRRVMATGGAYDELNDRTAFSLPFASYLAAGRDIVMAGELFGHMPRVYNRSGTVITVEGNYAGKPAYVGVPYYGWCELSPFRLREKLRNGGEGNSMPGVELTVASLKMSAPNTVGMEVAVDRAYRGLYTYRISAARTGTKTSKQGQLVLGRVQPSMSILANADDVKVTIQNSGPFPYSLQSLRWTGEANPKGY